MVEQRARGGVLRVEQAREQAFDKPFGHGFARVLAGNHPHFQIALHLVADGEQIHVAPFYCAAQIVNLAQAAALRIAQ